MSLRRQRDTAPATYSPPMTVLPKLENPLALSTARASLASANEKLSEVQRDVANGRASNKSLLDAESSARAASLRFAEAERLTAEAATPERWARVARFNELRDFVQGGHLPELEPICADLAREIVRVQEEYIAKITAHAHKLRLAVEEAERLREAAPSLGGATKFNSAVDAMGLRAASVENQAAKLVWKGVARELRARGCPVGRTLDLPLARYVRADPSPDGDGSF